MGHTGDRNWPAFADQDDYARARDVLRRADYTESGLCRTLGVATLLSTPLIDVPPWLRRTRGLSPHETLIRLLHLGVPVPEQAARRAVEPMSLADWTAAGLLAPPDAEGKVAARVKVLPALGGVLAADTLRIEAARAPGDFVLPPGLTTLQLGWAMIGLPARRTLDLGTGCGALACLAAGHSDEVVATDKNRRAVEFARFNAMLNGRGQVACLAGDLFEPVEERRFDRIVCNPPFVVSPSAHLMFRDSGVRGDRFCRELTRAAAERLEEGGFCQLTCNCVDAAARPWQEELASWLDGLGCDAVAWLLQKQTASEYAMTWIISTETQDPQEVPRLYDQWLDYFDGEGIEALAYLLVSLRRAGGRTNWTRIEDFPRRIAGPCGSDVLDCFALSDFLADHRDDAALLDCRFRPADGVRIRREHAVRPEGRLRAETWLRATGGAEHSVGVDPAVDALMAECDGRAPLREAIGRFAASMRVSPETAVPAALRTVRALLDRGLLRPVYE